MNNREENDSGLISICIPAFNAYGFIRETLDSVKRQTYKNWELIVVEDGSDDGTRDIIKRFEKEVNQKIYYFRNIKNLGLPATRNFASNMANGNWIAYLDSDDVWEPIHLQTLVDASIKQPLSDLIHSGVVLFDNISGKIIKERNPNLDAIKHFPLSLFNREYPVQPSSIMISRKLFIETQGFNEGFKYTEDLEMWFRCAKLGYRFTFTGLNTLKYRIHSTAMTTHSLELALGTAKTYDLYSDWDVIPIKLRRKAAAEHWLSVSRIARKNNIKLSMIYISNSFKYKFTLKQLFYFLIILSNRLQQKVFLNHHLNRP